MATHIHKYNDVTYTRAVQPNLGDVASADQFKYQEVSIISPQRDAIPIDIYSIRVHWKSIEKKTKIKKQNKTKKYTFTYYVSCCHRFCDNMESESCFWGRARYTVHTLVSLCTVLIFCFDFLLLFFFIYLFSLVCFLVRLFLLPSLLLTILF